jgi:WD40 repeat protein
MRSHALALAVVVVLTGPGLFAQQMKERAVFKGHTVLVGCVAMSRDSKLLASGGGDIHGDELKLWDTATGKEIATLAGYKHDQGALAFSPDGKLLACGGIKSGVMVWDVTARTHLVTLQEDRDWVHDLAFSPDGSRLASVGDRVVTLWDVKRAKKVSSFRPLVGAWRVAFSPDLKTVASPNYQDIDLWDVAEGKERAVLSEQRGAVHAVVFSADGKSLVAASSYSRYARRTWVSFGEVKLWDVATGRERSTLKGEFGHITTLALSPDAKTLAALDARDLDGDVLMKLLDVATGKEVLRHSGKGRSLLAVTYAADGTLLLVESPDGKTLKLWELPPRKEGAKGP